MKKRKKRRNKEEEKKKEEGSIKVDRYKTYLCQTFVDLGLVESQVVDFAVRDDDRPGFRHYK